MKGEKLDWFAAPGNVFRDLGRANDQADDEGWTSRTWARSQRPARCDPAERPHLKASGLSLLRWPHRSSASTEVRALTVAKNSRKFSERILRKERAQMAGAPFLAGLRHAWYLQRSSPRSTRGTPSRLISLIRFYRAELVPAKTLKNKALTILPS